MAPENTSATPTTKTKEQPKQRVSVSDERKAHPLERERKAYEQCDQNGRLESAPVASGVPPHAKRSSTAQE